MKCVMIRNGKKRGGYEATYFRINTLSKILNQPLDKITRDDSFFLTENRSLSTFRP